MLGLPAADVDVELTVQADVIAVVVQVADGVADELPVLVVGQGLKGLYGPVELAGGAAPLYLLSRGARFCATRCFRPLFVLGARGGGFRFGCDTVVGSVNPVLDRWRGYG